jgi:hypothetical protein
MRAADRASDQRWVEAGRYLLAALLALVPLALVPEIFALFVVPKQALLLAGAASLLVVLSRIDRPWPFDRGMTAAVAAVVAVDVAAFIFAYDRTGAILGLYNWRLGIATHLALLVLFVASAWLIRTVDELQSVLVRAAPVIPIVLIYAIAQRADLDPIDIGSTDTSENVLSTIGARNELGAFALLALPYAWAVGRWVGVRWPASKAGVAGSRWGAGTG